MQQSSQVAQISLPQHAVLLVKDAGVLHADISLPGGIDTFLSEILHAE